MNYFYLLLKPAAMVEGGESSVGMGGGKEVRISFLRYGYKEKVKWEKCDN